MTREKKYCSFLHEHDKSLGGFTVLLIFACRVTFAAVPDLTLFAKGDAVKNCQLLLVC